MSLLDLSFVVRSLAQEEVLVRRYNFSSYDSNGKAVARTYVTFDTVASVQASGGEDLNRDTDSDNASQTLNIYTPFALKLGDEVLTSFGRCQVERLHQRENMGAFCKATARILDDSEPKP